MLISLYFSGTMTNPPRENSILFKSECQWNGHHLTNCSFTGKHDVPADTPQAAATVDSSASFLRVLLQSPMRREDWNIKHLDLSNHLISNITLSPLAHFRALEILNLSNSSLRSISLDLPSAKSLWGKRHRSHLRNRLPSLKLLILRRNSLSDIPEGKANFKRWTRPKNEMFVSMFVFSVEEIAERKAILSEQINEFLSGISSYNMWNS